MTVYGQYAHIVCMNKSFLCVDQLEETLSTYSIFCSSATVLAQETIKEKTFATLKGQVKHPHNSDGFGIIHLENKLYSASCCSKSVLLALVKHKKEIGRLRLDIFICVPHKKGDAWLTDTTEFLWVKKNISVSEREFVNNHFHITT